MGTTSTYPSEVYPGDETVLGLDGTLDVLTGLPYVAKGVGPTTTPTYEIQYNRRLWRQNRILAAVRQGMVVDEGSLKLGVYPIQYTVGGVAKTFLGATNQSMPDDSTRKVYLDSANLLQIAADFPADATTYLPLATVTASAGAVTIADERPVVMFAAPLATPTDHTLPFAPSVFLGGVLAVKVYEIEWVAPFDFTLRNVTGRVNTAPSGADLIVDVRVDGTSIFANQSEMVVIADGTQQDTSATKNHAVSSGEVITFEVEQVGSGTAGADLTLVLNGLAGLGAV